MRWLQWAKKKTRMLTGNPSDRLWRRFWRRYVFATSHKTVAAQFLWTALLMSLVGVVLALAVRWQLAFPWEPIPWIGRLAFADQDGQTSPGFFSMLCTLHGTVMLWLVVTPIVVAALGHWLVPSMIGARDMAFPTASLLSYWVLWLGVLFLGLSLVFGSGPSAGWASNPILAITQRNVPGSAMAQILWLLGCCCASVAFLIGAVNQIVTILNGRAAGVTLFRMPLTAWGLLFATILQVITLPAFAAACLMQLTDSLPLSIHTCFFVPSGLAINNAQPTVGGGWPLLWQHLFAFWRNGAVSVVLLPVMGLISDLLAGACRKSAFSYRALVYAMASLAGLALIAWGRHLSASTMHPVLVVFFSIPSLAIVVAIVAIVATWIGALWDGNVELNSVTIHCLASASMLIVGGLSGVFLAVAPLANSLHGTQFVVAHLHYMLCGPALFAALAALNLWFPRLSGRRMNQAVERLHVVITFLAFHGTFFPMFLLGAVGMPRRHVDPHLISSFEPLLIWSQVVTISSIVLVLAQLLLVGNVVYSLFRGTRAEALAGNDVAWKSLPSFSSLSDRGELQTDVSQQPHSRATRPTITDSQLRLWLFLGAEGLFLGALIVGGAVLRTQAIDWSACLERAGIRFWLGVVATAALVLTDLLAVSASRTSRQHCRDRAKKTLWIAMAMGTVFLGIKAYECCHMISADLLPGHIAENQHQALDKSVREIETVVEELVAALVADRPSPDRRTAIHQRILQLQTAPESAEALAKVQALQELDDELRNLKEKLRADAMTLTSLRVRLERLRANPRIGLYLRSAHDPEPIVAGNVFASVYFLLTSLHTLHVFAALLLLSVPLLRRDGMDDFDSHLRGVTLYWHSGLLVWAFLFPLIYIV